MERGETRCTKVDAVVHDHWPLGNSIQLGKGLRVQMLRKLVVWGLQMLRKLVVWGLQMLRKLVVWGLQMHVRTCTTVNC